MHRWRRFLLILLAGLLPLAAGARADNISAALYFPASGMPEAERERLAHRLLGKQRIADAEFDDYFRGVNKALAPHDDYLIVAADIGRINAFAYYGGIIVMFKGLMRLTKNEDEFLGVVAHEMGHIKLGHFQKQADNAKKAAALSLPLLIAGVLLEDPETKEALIAGSGGLLSSQIYAYSRELEHEADIFGLDTMLNGGRDGRAMADIFARLGGGGVNEYISTHPAPGRRGAYLAARLRDAPPPRVMPDAGFYLLREKLMLDNIVARDFERQRRGAVAAAETPLQKIVAQYGLLLLATKTRNAALGEEMSAALARHAHPYIARAVGENMMLRGAREPAREVLTAAHARHPQSAALALALLRLHERTKQHAAALALYDALPAALRERPDILHQAGRAAAHLNKRVLSNYLLARGHANNGYFEQSLKQIAVAEKFKGGGIETLTSLTRLKRAVQKELKLLREKKI